MSTDNVMHRELPYAESADLTPDRYQPLRCLTTLGVKYRCTFKQRREMLVTSVKYPSSTDVKCCLFGNVKALYNDILRVKRSGGTVRDCFVLTPKDCTSFVVGFFILIFNICILQRRIKNNGKD